MQLHDILLLRTSAILPEAISAFFDKFGMTLWTFDLDFALASGNTDLLFAARTGINVIFFALLQDIFFSEKSLSDTGGH